MWLATLSLFGLTFAAFPVDMDVAEWFASHRLPGDIRKLLTFAEVFGHGLGAVFIILTAATLDRRPAQTAWYLSSRALGAGLCANVLKLVLGRYRPYHCPSLEVSVWSTFTEWFPFLQTADGHHWLDSRYLSFPSGHSAVAAALAIALSSRYPRGQWIFMFFALLAGIQRCFSLAHFPSDVLAGFAIGSLWCQICSTVGHFYGSKTRDSA